jgi:hypothetical protein
MSDKTEDNPIGHAKEILIEHGFSGMGEGVSVRI